MKAMISQPMGGLTDESIVKTKEKAKQFLESRGYEVVNTFFVDDGFSEESLKKSGVTRIPLYYLAKSLESMSLCDIVYFAKGWEGARGCRIEHDVAIEYGLQVIYEE